MELSGDLHVHGRHTISVSRSLDLRTLVRAAARKGIGLLGCGDCLHRRWRSQVVTLPQVAEGTYALEGVRLLLQTEVIDTAQVHHLLVFPSLEAAEAFARAMPARARLHTQGRPHVHASAERIAEVAVDLGALFGPAHAFTPWTGFYAHYPSLEAAYGAHARKVSFLELGLSADTAMGSTIPELHGVPFLSNSDAHSAHPHRIAREFTTLRLRAGTFAEVALALAGRQGRGIVANVGLPPALGKYHRTACSRCHSQVTPTAAARQHWRCACGGTIVLGVRDRIRRLAKDQGAMGAAACPRRTIDSRPPYLGLVPLTQVLASTYGSTVTSKRVLRAWDRLLQVHGSEVQILLHRDPAVLATSDIPQAAEVATTVRGLRNGTVRIAAGGGGAYGRLVLPSVG